MNKLAKIKERQKAAEMMAFNPEMSVKEIATTLKVAPTTVQHWRRDPNFVDMVYELYMIEFGSDIPAVLKSMIREAKAGNVQAARLVLEHSGKLVKNINVTIDSPFEKFLKADKTPVEFVDAEVQDIVEDIPEIQDVELPERKIEDQEERTRTEYTTIKREKHKHRRKVNRNRMYHWKKRAKAVGVDVLPNGRPTKAQKQDWIKKVKKAELEHKRAKKR
tara:strand:+ start:3744 stop:4400 length:657 start_codon:yes stop_codon:yes gene_type:complete